MMPLKVLHENESHEQHAMPQSQARPENVIASLASVTKQFGQHTAVDELSLNLYQGEVVALLGQNGAGKTTAVRMMLGLTEPTSGEVRIFGRDPRERAARMRIGAMLQVGAVPEHLYVREHIDLFSSYYPNPLPAAEVMAIAGLTGLENRRFGKLSGGEKQRVLFGVALCGNPDLLFLDEPTVGMDIETRQALWSQIRQFAARGKTVLLTTHYLEEADALATRVVVVQKGKLIAEGTPAQIKATQGHKNIRCRTVLELAFIAALPSVITVRREGPVTHIAVSESESVARALMLHDAALSDLEINNVALETAFLALTASAGKS
ncbi:ABC transporter ATP-binding protein [Massilia antarctica]|nr:ABC transporter ATP-binding protein [Massilia antarctica]